MAEQTSTQTQGGGSTAAAAGGAQGGQTSSTGGNSQAQGASQTQGQGQTTGGQQTQGSQQGQQQQQGQSQTTTTQQQQTQSDPKAETGKTQTQTTVAPEKYDLKVPEKSPLDAKHVERIAGIAREQGLSNDEAQAILEHDHEVVYSVLAAQQEQVKQVSAQWLEQSKADPVIGGEKLTENVNFSKRACEAVFSPEIRQIIDSSGIGNHPKFIADLAKLQREYFAEDKMIITKAAPPKAAYEGDQRVASKLYGGSEGKTES